VWDFPVAPHWFVRVPFVVKCLIALAVAAALTMSRALAVVLLNEPFSYTNGPITNVSAGLWANHSGTDNQVNVTNSEVYLTSDETEDVNVPLAGQPYPAAGATNIFYARFTARFTELPTAGGSWFACFKDGTLSGFRCRVFALDGDPGSGKFRVGLSTANNNSATQTNQTELSLDAPFTIVMRLTNTSSVSTLWLNPSSESDPSLTTAEATSTFTVAGFALRQNTGMGSLALDNLVVGTSFADVLSPSTPVAPFITTSPTNQMIARGSNVTLVAAATGTPPLRYQWLFNGSPIPSATNTALSLTNISLTQQGDYAFVVTNVAAAVTGAPAALTITVTATASTNAAFTLLTYNAHGAAIPDWSTNSAQVQAIGRQVQFLDPDIITFQEIPLTNNGTAQMTNFVTAFRPGYFLATNSGNDGFIRSVILSRFPITRSAKWLDGINLASFGYNGFFTRDLFEAEIRVPSLPQPLHVFTVHLKSGQDSDDTAKRAAETRAISNFFKITFLPTYPLRPYLLTGDMNEDVADPPATGVALPTLTSTATGLKLATPINPVTESHLTFSIRAASLTRRYDYVLPCALLATNIIGGHVFRTDVATNIAPALTNDCVTASDHLPVFVSFASPYATPFRIITINTTSNTVTLTWNTVPGGQYGVEASTNLSAWTAIATYLLASNATLSFTTNRLTSLRFYRISSTP
jgi:endonuclease/exonuclease/phosphatase family metal-dependent hydrolase